MKYVSYVDTRLEVCIRLEIFACFKCVSDIKYVSYVSDLTFVYDLKYVPVLARERLEACFRHQVCIALSVFLLERGSK